MAADYYQALRDALTDASAISLEERKKIYSLAQKALPLVLKSYTKQEAYNEELALGLSILRIEAEVESQSNGFDNSKRRFDSVFARSIAFVLLCLWIGFPAAAPPELLPQWLLDHAWILLLWCAGFTAAFFFSLYGLRVYLDELVSKGHQNTSTMKSIALEFPWVLPILVGAALVPAAGIMYNLGNLSRYYNPFGQDFSFVDAYLFLVDQAAKGMFSELMDFMKLSFQHKLVYNPRDHFTFWLFMISYKTFMGFVGAGALILILRWALITLLRKLRILLRPFWRDVKRGWSMYYAWSQRQREKQLGWLNHVIPGSKAFVMYAERKAMEQHYKRQTRSQFFKAAFSNPGDLLMTITEASTKASPKK